MSWILVVQPDWVQARTLREALRTHIAEDIVIVETLDEALSRIERSVPDVILLPTLIAAGVEDYIVNYLSTMPGTGHVQILGMPHLERPEQPMRRRRRFQWPPWRRHRPVPRAVGIPVCDPGVFTRDVVAYLAGARALRREIAIHAVPNAGAWTDRRTEPRFTNADVPWISFVRIGGERAALIDVSSRGALLRTHTRPDHNFLRRADSNVRHRPSVVFGLDSYREIQAMGRVIRVVPSRTTTRTQYEVAFCFDDAVGLHLPTAGSLVPAGYDFEGSVEEMIVNFR